MDQQHQPEQHYAGLDVSLDATSRDCREIGLPTDTVGEVTRLPGGTYCCGKSGRRHYPELGKLSKTFPNGATAAHMARTASVPA